MQESCEKLNNQAIKLASEGSYDEAIACFMRTISLETQNYLLWFNLGITYRDSGEFEYARESMEKAFMLNPNDEEIIEALYKASQAGVKVLLNIRGVCMLVPGIPGLSENIRVVSIVDRYLEHSRIFYFQNDGDEELYLSSADWMSRNLDRRIELMFPILDSKVFEKVKEILEVYFKDTENALELKENGQWVQIETAKDAKPFRAQEYLYKKYKKRADSVVKNPKIEFEVRRKD